MCSLKFLIIMNDRSPFFNGTFSYWCLFIFTKHKYVCRVCITFFQEIYIRNSELNKTQLSSSPSPRYAILAIRFLTFDWLASFQVQSRFWFDICIKSTIYMYTRIRVCEVQIAILIAHSMHRDTECNVVNCIFLQWDGRQIFFPDFCGSYKMKRDKGFVRWFHQEYCQRWLSKI